MRIDNLTGIDPFQEERIGLINKILKLKEEIKRLKKDRTYILDQCDNCYGLYGM